MADDYGYLDSSDDEVYIGPPCEKEKIRSLSISQVVDNNAVTINVVEATITSLEVEEKCEDALAETSSRNEVKTLGPPSAERIGKLENGQNVAVVSELDDTLTRMEKLLALAEQTDANSDIHEILKKANPFQKDGDNPVSPSTVYGTPRASVNSESFASFASVLSPKRDVPFSIKEEPELEVTTTESPAPVDSPKAKGRKTSTPITNKENVGTPTSGPNRVKTPLRAVGNSPSTERFATPLTTPLQNRGVKKEDRNTPVLKSAGGKPRCETPQNFKTPPHTPRSGTFVKNSSGSRHAAKPRTPSSLTKKVVQKLFTEDKNSRIPRPGANPKLANVVSPIGRYIKERPVPNPIRRLKPPTVTLSSYSHDRTFNRSLDSSSGSCSLNSSQGNKENADPKTMSAGRRPAGLQNDQKVIPSIRRPSGLPLPPVHRVKPDESKVQDVTKPSQILPKGKIGKLMAPNLKYQIQKHAGRVHVGDAEVSVLLSKPAELKN